MNHYEAMYVIDAMVEEQPRKDLIERFSNLIVQNGGTVERIDEWGKRNLAYLINYKTIGYYVLMYFTAPTTMPRELERNFQISDSVLRYLVVANDGKLPPKREFRPAAPATPAAPAQVITIADTATDEMVVTATETSEEPKAEDAAPAAPEQE